MFSRESVIIKDGKKLSFDYVPKKLCGRDDQMMLLSTIFRSVIDDGRSETAYLHGTVGTGKTSVALRFMMDAIEYARTKNIAMDYIYVNCRKMSSDTLVMHQCVSYFDPHYPEKGYSAQDMLKSFKAFVAKSGRRMVIILDEVNLLLSRSNTTELIYQLSRLGEGATSNPISVSLILISQEYALDRLDTASLSSFKRYNTVRFQQYSRNQLRDIIQQRVDEAMVLGTVTDEAIDIIADTVAGAGDARMAIDLLDKAARHAEMRPNAVLTGDDVRAMSDLVYSVVNAPKLAELGQNELLAYLAVARAIKDKPSVTVSAAEKTYAIVCEEYEVTARKHTQFITFIDSLINQNLLVNKGTDSTRSKLVGLPDIDSKTLAKRIAEALEHVR